MTNRLEETVRLTRRHLALGALALPLARPALARRANVQLD